MTLPSGLRKLILAVHLTVSVGWIGAVMAYLALVAAAMSIQDSEFLRSAWRMMELTGWNVIVPLALAALLTGLILALGTRWGLFRHYWVLISLALTIFACWVLLDHMGTVSYYAGIAGEPGSSNLLSLQSGLSGELLHAGLGLVVLLVVQVLNVYKPQGMTPYGWRKQEEERIAKQKQIEDTTP
jgi:hypothetical protein